jgi:hypothetical protein
MEQISNNVKDIIKREAKKAEEIIQGAQKCVNEKQADFDRAVESLRLHQRELHDAQSKFDYAERDLEKKEKAVDNLCRIKSCGKSKLSIIQTLGRQLATLVQLMQGKTTIL